MYVNSSPFSATLFPLASTTVFTGATFTFVGVDVHVFAAIHGSVGLVGFVGVLPSPVTAFNTANPNPEYCVSDVGIVNSYVIVAFDPFTIISTS